MQEVIGSTPIFSTLIIKDLQGNFVSPFLLGTTFRLGPKSSGESGGLGKAEIEPWNKPVLLFPEKEFSHGLTEIKTKPAIAFCLDWS
jgi:hypothetical protein